MTLGVSSFAFGWAMAADPISRHSSMTELDLLAYARRHGLGLVQLGDHVPLHDYTGSRLDALGAAARAQDAIELEIGARGLTESHLHRYLALATRLGCRLLRFVIDRTDYEPSADDITALLRNALPLIETTGIILGIENHDRFPARTLRLIIEAAGSAHVGACLDTANSLGAGEGIEHVIDQLGPHTVNLHLKDIAITRVPYAMGFVVEGRPAGQGDLDIRWVCERIAAYGRCRTTVLETWTPPEATLEATLTKERDWTNQGLEFLKPLFARP